MHIFMWLTVVVVVEVVVVVVVVVVENETNHTAGRQMQLYS